MNSIPSSLTDYERTKRISIDCECMNCGTFKRYYGDEHLPEVCETCSSGLCYSDVKYK